MSFYLPYDVALALYSFAMFVLTSIITANKEAGKLQLDFLKGIINYIKNAIS